MFRNLRASGLTTNKRNFTGPILIDVEQDRATALSYRWVATMPIQSNPGRSVGGDGRAC